MTKRKICKLSAVVVLLMIFIFNSITPIYAAKSTSSKIPIISKITTTKKSVTLSWSKAQGSSAYYVYKKIKNGKYKKIATLNKKKHAYKDNKVVTGKKYTYKVVSKKGAKKYYSKGRSVTPAKIKAPALVSVKRSSSGNKEYATLSWKSIKGYSYYVLRKSGQSSYGKIATIKANSKTASYTDKSIKKDRDYTYTIRPIRKSGKILYKYGDYDRKGITTVSKKPEVNVDFTNLHASISWKAVKGADGYEIFRKYGLNGKYKAIAAVKADNNKICTYKDIYRKSFTSSAEKSRLCAGYFIDPSSNGIIYTVRAYKNIGGKKSYSNYYKDGAFALATPSIVNVTKNSPNKATIEWGTVKNAKKYYLYTGYNDANGNRHWEKVAAVDHKSATRQKATITVNQDHPFYTVKAMSIKNGKTIYSAYDKGFNISNRKYSDTNILYIGDSITFGSPYKGVTTKEVFSYPWRINQLTNVKYYNPSIPGSTYSYKPYDGKGYHRYRLVTDVAEKIKYGETPEQALHSNRQTYKDFDVVVMAAGTNDYLDDAVFGDLDSTNIKEFNGAINTIMGYINEGSEQRVSEGKPPIKVVFVDLFYSDRTFDSSKTVNRHKTPNKIGLTLTDYQNDINSLIEKYRAEGVEIYQFHTNNIVTESTCPYLTSDNLHMTRFTYTQIGNQMTKFLINNKIL